MFTNIASTNNVTKRVCVIAIYRSGSFVTGATNIFRMTSIICSYFFSVQVNALVI